MKFVKFILPVAIVLFFTGCLDINENVEIKKDGSGQMVMDMDMSQMIEMIQTMGKEALAEKGVKNMDTTINLKDVVDTASGLSAEKKALLRPGKVHIKLNLEDKVFKTNMTFPFTSQENFQKLYTAMGDGSLSSTSLLSGMGGGGEGGPSPDVNQFNGIYDFTCKDGLMAKKVNEAKWKALKDDPQMAQIKQASQMGVEINYTTTIVLPRAVKKVDNPLAKLSEDKKTVIMKYNLIDVFDHPEQFNYRIEY
ncbi:MAG: hypothetical protein JST68_03370 [Bacteroidetes bacterium]|nr:hypothetical protein [Bacteroidota bacterium]